MDMERRTLELSHDREASRNSGNPPAHSAAADTGGTNGHPAGENEETALTPREIAIDTLHTLRLYIDRVVVQCARLPLETDAFLGEELFQQLLDGLEVINEGLTLSRRILKPGLNARLDLLEADLISILRDLVGATQEIQIEHRMELISQHLVKNLRDWRESGIPALLEAAGESA